VSSPDPQIWGQAWVAMTWREASRADRVPWFDGHEEILIGDADGVLRRMPSDEQRDRWAAEAIVAARNAWQGLLGGTPREGK